MSLKGLIELAKIAKEKAVGPSGREYRTKQIIGADKGHWLVEYGYRETYGWSSETAWERMADREMRLYRCFADDYEGDRSRL